MDDWNGGDGYLGVVMRVFLGGSGKAAGRREPPFRSPAWLPGRGRSRGGVGIGVPVGFGFDTTTLGMKGDGTAEILHQMTYISLLHFIVANLERLLVLGIAAGKVVLWTAAEVPEKSRRAAVVFTSMF